MRNKLLILDLDETLVFGTEQPLAQREDFRVAEYFIYKRPGLDDFIRFADEHFKVAVWTASSADYAVEVVSRIFRHVRPPEFVWTRERCTWRVHSELRMGYWIKDLKKVRRRGYRLEQVLMVDDTSGKMERNYGNHISISPFEGDPADRELGRLSAYLLGLKDAENVRTVDKRYWRSAAVKTP